MSGYLAAQRMVTTANLAAQAAGHDLFATLDPSEAAALLGSGQAVVLVNPPQTTWETWTVQVHDFEITILSPDTDPLIAWPILDGIAEDLSGPLEIDTARLTVWQPNVGDSWPCIHLTLDTTTTDQE